MLNITLMGMMALIALAWAGNTLKPGDPAPDFALKDADGTVHRLKDYSGKIIALYFYPKDDTPGCTTEACNLRDNYQSLLDAGIVVLGVSYDDSVSHKKFREKYNLPFPLLSDTDKKAAEAYGAKGMLTGFLVAQRKTFLIDGDGKILHIFENVDTGSHARQILDIVKKLKG